MPILSNLLPLVTIHCLVVVKLPQELSRKMEKSSRPGPKMFAGVTHAKMLEQLAEGRKAEARDWYLRCKLNWHEKAKSFLRHVRYGEQELSAQDERDIEAAYIRYHADQIEANRAEDRRLFATIRSSLEYLESADPEFHRPAIEALGELADRLRGVAGETRKED